MTWRWRLGQVELETKMAGCWWVGRGVRMRVRMLQLRRVVGVGVGHGLLGVREMRTGEMVG